MNQMVLQTGLLFKSNRPDSVKSSATMYYIAITLTTIYCNLVCIYIYPLVIKLIVKFAGDIRLVGGSTLSEGRVEIHFHENWWAVCGYTWDPLDAAVACRQLGFTGALNTYSSSSQNDFGWSELRNWRIGLKCAGNESKLLDCQKDLNPDIAGHCHSASYQAVAGVVCSNDSRLTLQRGMVGYTLLVYS